MAWDDDDHGDPRWRRRREYDDDYGMSATQSGSGLVTLVGVISIVWGTLVLFAALFFILIALIAMAGGHGQDREGEISIIVVAISMVGLLLGGLYLTGGIGLHGRRNWARVMILILAVLNCLSAAAGVLGLVNALSNLRHPEEVVVLLLFSCIGIVLNLGYGLLVYLTLLRAKYAQEFTQ